MATDIYLGPPGAPVKLPGNVAPVEPALPLGGATHELAGGGIVVDRAGEARRRYTIAWEHLTTDELAIIERLALVPGPLVLDMPDRRNRLTANQSTGSDVRRTADGCIARFQGAVTSSTAQARSAPRSFAWATETALGVTGRGFYLYNSPTVPDRTWHPVRPSTSYVNAGYLRASAAVSMLAGFDWHDAAGAFISASLGNGAALPTANWNTRVWHSAVSPATAAYGNPIFLNTTTTGAAVTIYLDDPMVWEGTAAAVEDIPAHVIGTGVPRVAPVELPMSSRLLGYTSPSLILQEVG